jgi:nucleotide-binding universal stress UspA family protein
LGDPARVLTGHARTCDARVLVTGRGRHQLIGRMLGGELLPRLLEVGDVPIFAVEPTLQRLPRRVVMAMDFSEQSLYAAQVALGFVAPDALITLVHVTPRTRDWDSVTRASDDVYQRQARTSLAQVRASLERAELRFAEILLSGKPAETLIAYATDNDADLIVSATHGYGAVRRAMLGSVASTLVRSAPCSVLCVPGSAHSAATAYARRVTSGQTTAIAPELFDHELAAFSTRNQRRLCAVEIHANGSAPQTLGHGLPLVGATYDPSARSVALMFGSSELRGQHLTHAVANVQGIEFARDMHGRDVILRLLHEDGTTLVQLE